MSRDNTSSAPPLAPVTAALSDVRPLVDNPPVSSKPNVTEYKEFEEMTPEEKKAHAREWAGFYVDGIKNNPDNNIKCYWGLSKLEEQVLTDPNPCMSWDEFQALVKEEHRRYESNESNVSASSPMAASSPLALND